MSFLHGNGCLIKAAFNGDLMTALLLTKHRRMEIKQKGRIGTVPVRNAALFRSSVSSQPGVPIEIVNCDENLFRCIRRPHRTLCFQDRTFPHKPIEFPFGVRYCCCHPLIRHLGSILHIMLLYHLRLVSLFSILLFVFLTFQYLIFIARTGIERLFYILYFYLDHYFDPLLRLLRID